MQRYPTGSPKAFTLLEVVFAIAIFVAGAVGLLQALNLIGLATNEAALRHDVDLHLKSLLNETCFQPDLRVDRRRIDDRYDGVEFEIAIDTADLSDEDGDSLDEMFRVTIEARSNLPGNGRGDVIGRAERLVYRQLWQRQGGLTP